MGDTQEDIILAEEDTQSASNEKINNATEVASETPETSEHKYSLKEFRALPRKTQLELINIYLLQDKCTERFKEAPFTFSYSSLVNVTKELNFEKRYIDTQVKEPDEATSETTDNDDAYKLYITRAKRGDTRKVTISSEVLDIFEEIVNPSNKISKADKSKILDAILLDYFKKLRDLKDKDLFEIYLQAEITRLV